MFAIQSKYIRTIVLLLAHIIWKHFEIIIIGSVTTHNDSTCRSKLANSSAGVWVSPVIPFFHITTPWIVGNSVYQGLLDCSLMESPEALLPGFTTWWTGIGPLTQSLTVLRSVDPALCEAEGMILLKGSVESLAVAQALSQLHSSGASCPILSLPTLTEAPEATKDLLCWPLLTLASSHWLERRGRLQKCLIMLTPQQRMHLQTTGVYVLSLRGTFLYSKGNVSGLGSSRHLLCGGSDLIAFHLKNPKEDISVGVHQKYSFLPFLELLGRHLK